MDFVLVRTFSDYVEANIVMGNLESQGINCWLKDENTVTINPLYNYAVGGIKLMVADDQAEEAMQILQQLHNHRKEKYCCPKCGSHDIEFITSNRRPVNWFTSIISWFVAGYALSAKKLWHCFSCGAEFEKPSESDDVQFLSD